MGGALERLRSIDTTAADRKAAAALLERQSRKNSVNLTIPRQQEVRRKGGSIDAQVAAGATAAVTEFLLEK